MAAKTREEKNQERKAHLAVAPTPETAQVLTGAPAVTLDQRIDDAAKSGNYSDPSLHIALYENAMAHLALTGLNEIRTHQFGEVWVAIHQGSNASCIGTSEETSIRGVKDMIAARQGISKSSGTVDLMGDSPPTSDTESATALQAKDPNEAFLTFIRSPKGVDLSDARVRDTFDLEHRLKTAYFAGWEAARA